MKGIIRTLAGEIICIIDDVNEKTPKDLIDHIDKHHEEYRLLSMTLVTPSGVPINKHNEYISNIISSQEQQSVIELTIYSHDRKMCCVEEMDRIIKNIGEIFNSDECKCYERTMYEIMNNVSSDINEPSDYIVSPGSNISEQFSMLTRPSWWKNLAYCRRNKVEEVERVANLIRNFIMTKKIITQMVQKLVVEAFWTPYIIQIIIILCNHTYDNIELDIDHDELSADDTVELPDKEFRRYVIDEVQNKFEFLLNIINEVPCKMLSCIIIISKLYASGFISKVIVAKILSDLFGKRNLSNRTFIISYFNIIRKICAIKLNETEDGKRLNEEIFKVMKNMMKEQDEDKKDMKKQDKDKKAKKREI